MILYPAIDLKDGRCVRLAGGRMEDATIFNEDPADQAVLFQTAGFTWLHVIDLDGAFAGAPRNAGAVSRILSVASIPVQIGGGVRSLENVSYWLNAGASRVILGTAAVRNPQLVREAARDFPEQVAVALDSRDGKVAVEGWAEQTELDVAEMAKRFEDAGVAALIVTDIARDGLKTGVNVELTGRVADAVSIPVIASGGVKSAADISALRARAGRAIHGCILGRALYDGDLSAQAAIEAAA
ncbi:MAG TPA: 1-(5-phosphoribosyl)-5-[(5-phosphoribosylamino)methylideneamino]imidazole-4-carboxamide isomerase [Caulobacterales bacterium]|nr:1-(5-phosphoribosyl)-5-[(5-phosphoribosylamino)methylideneamino]imidazole-4-carboxamide isomerase [Caulobacterales bacterium]